MKRLVELDPQTMYALEVDEKRLRREAAELKSYLDQLPDSQDQLNLKSTVMPFCDGALNGTMQFPIDTRMVPLNISRILDVGDPIPSGFEELYARFFNTAVGSRAEVRTPIHKNSKVYAYMEFEE